MNILSTDDSVMTEEEFARELKGSLLVLTTSSPDKRDIYRLLFSSHAKDANHHAGLDFFYTDSGALGIAPRKTREQTGGYEGNLDEKALQQLNTLQDSQVQQNIRLKLMAGADNEFNPQKINIIGMTEDSGWELKFNNEETEKKFVEIIIRELKPKLREQDYWLLEKLHETGFPGPNLKPIQEHLEGGFHALMTMIYDAAEELSLKELRFTSSTNTSFVSPRTGKHFSKSFTSGGKLLTRDEYEERLMATQKGEAINSNFVHIPDGQAEDERKTIDALIQNGMHGKSKKDLPADYSRRDLTEYLQNLVGKRRSSIEERKRHVRIAFATPEMINGIKPCSDDIRMPNINDYAIVGLPTNAELKACPHTKAFDDADVIVLIPQITKHTDNQLRADPNLGLLLNFVVTAETDPESMGIPVVLDNRSGAFDHALELISDAFAQGRLMGDKPFYVANTDAELKDTLSLLKDVKQRAPVIKTPSLGGDHSIKKPLMDRVKNDGVFTVFVGGGHANNSKRDLEDATAFGYYCAQQGWRIVTGAGSIEGSMGAVHTGFIQYHLDNLRTTPGKEAIKASLSEYADGAGRWDAEKIILENPGLVDNLADKGIIPRDMFYGYSMKPLLEMESPSGLQPPGITYFESGNRVRRLAGLLAPGTKIFLPGSIGTDEEFEETIKQHLEARLRKKQGGIANDDAFADGTPDDQGTMIIYNRNGHLDRLLRNYGISGGDPVASTKRAKNNIIIVTSLEELQQVSKSTADNWLNRIKTKTGEGLARIA